MAFPSERADGKGWVSSLTGGNVIQADFDTTKPGQESAISFDEQLGAALGLWLLGGQRAPLLGLTGATAASEPDFGRSGLRFAALAAAFS